MKFDIKKLTVAAFAKGLRAKEFSAREVADAYFDEIKKSDEKIHAYLSTLQNEAIAEAERVDAMIAEGKELDALAGVPFGVKDNLLMKGTITTAGSKILETYRAGYDGTVVENFKSKHAVFLGKTNMDEFAMGGSTENSAFGPTRNPLNLDCVPGGSSGGSAAAVAGGMALAALGSDTGGSIRQPAAFCGIVGLKPTYGSVSRYGLMAMASSLDQIGPFTKTVEDCAMVFDALAAGHDERDATSVAHPFKKDLLQYSQEKARKLRIGIPKEYFGEGLDPKIARAIETVIAFYKKQGCEVKEISLPHSAAALATYYILMPAEVSSNMARFDGIRYGKRAAAKNLWEVYDNTRSQGFGAEVKRRIILGTFVLASGYYDAYYAKAQKVRALICKDFDDAFKNVDVILGPTSPCLPFKIGEKSNDPLAMYLSDIYTVPVNLAGVPGMSVPVRGHGGDLPIGFQLIGKKWREADLFNLGRLYEDHN